MTFVYNKVGFLPSSRLFFSKDLFPRCRLHLGLLNSVALHLGLFLITLVTCNGLWQRTMEKAQDARMHEQMNCSYVHKLVTCTCFTNTLSGSFGTWDLTPKFIKSCIISGMVDWCFWALKIFMFFFFKGKIYCTKVETSDWIAWKIRTNFLFIVKLACLTNTTSPSREP